MKTELDVKNTNMFDIGKEFCILLDLILTSNNNGRVLVTSSIISKKKGGFMGGNGYIRLVFSVVILLLGANSAQAMHLKLPFEEVAQTADIIFVGTVEDQGCRFNELGTMICTDVYFKDTVIIHATDKSVQKDSCTIELTYAGGRVGDQGVTVSGAPAFKDGHRYLIFMLDDGKTYTSPIVGGPQGLFEVVKDDVTQEEFVLTAGGKVVVKASSKGIIKSKKRVSHIQDSMPVFIEPNGAIPDGFYPQPPTPADPSDSAWLYNRTAESKNDELPPLKLHEFLNYVKNTALKMPLKSKILKHGRQGHFYRNKGGKMVAEKLKISKPTARTLYNEQDYKDESDIQHKVPGGGNSVPPISLDSLEDEPVLPLGGDLCTCGYHDLPIVMEQVAEGRWDWPIYNDCMVMWNQFMDIYRYTDDDGQFGDNSENEFVGFIDDATYHSAYGFHWNGANGMTTLWWGVFEPDCGEIAQTDVFFNAAYNWTDDEDFALGNLNVILLRPAAMHETGHVWGLQVGIPNGYGCYDSYDYDHPTVAQGGYSAMVKNGRGIHRVDAYLIRRVYDNQTSILNITDVGVESYYASNGLRNSSTDKLVYTPGESITLSNVTIENMSYSAVSDLRLRVFLSTDRNITTSDYQMGGYWYWSSYCGECYNVVNLGTTIPSNIPAGTYYAGAIVTVNGFGNDDYLANNATSLYTAITIKPAAPTGVSASDGTYGDKIRVTWNSVPGSGVTYRVSRSTSLNGTKVELGNWQSSTDFNNYNAQESTTYYYWVKAQNSLGVSNYSEYDTGWRSPCNFSINPTGWGFGYSGGAGSVNVTTTSGCSWTTSSNDSWISITSGLIGNGNGTVNYSVASNVFPGPIPIVGAARTGHLTIAGHTFTVNQDGIVVATTTSTTSTTTTTTITTLPAICEPSIITCNQAVNGTLISDCPSECRAGGQYAYRSMFYGETGQNVKINVNSSSLDTYLCLHLPSGSVISNDDCNSSTNSQIPCDGSNCYTLPESGLYRIEASSYYSGVTGAFDLTFTCCDVVTTTTTFTTTSTSSTTTSTTSTTTTSTTTITSPPPTTTTTSTTTSTSTTSSTTTTTRPPTTGDCSCPTDGSSGCISGQATKISDGSPLAGKVVKLKRKSPRKPKEGKKQVTVTDSNGCYSFTNLIDGTYLLKTKKCKGGVKKQYVTISGGAKVNDVDFTCKK